MPHLSPMNWILAISMFWLFMITLMTKSWWSQFSSMPLNIPISKSTSSTQSTWKWH